MYVCMYVRTHVSMYVCMYLCMYACMYVCIHVCMYVCADIYAIPQHVYAIIWSSEQIKSFCDIPLRVIIVRHCLVHSTDCRAAAGSVHLHSPGPTTCPQAGRCPVNCAGRGLQLGWWRGATDGPLGKRREPKQIKQKTNSRYTTIGWWRGATDVPLGKRREPK